MMNLLDASMVPLALETLARPADSPHLTRQQTRTLDLLRKGSKNPPGSTRMAWPLDFFRSPSGLVAHSPTRPA